MGAGFVHNSSLAPPEWQTALPSNVVLNPNDVHVWRIRTNAHPDRFNELSPLLDPLEIDRANKYVRENDRIRFIVSRGMQRLILSKYLNTAPARLQFATDQNKKPQLLSTSTKRLQYNISHSRDWILLAIAVYPVGIDVEFINYAFGFDDVLPGNFSNEEITYIKGENSTEKFFKLWTRKEALLKATGQGLGDHLMYTPALEGKHALHYTLAGIGRSWQINSFMLMDNYAASIAYLPEALITFFDGDHIKLNQVLPMF